MAILGKVARWGGARVARRLAVSMPWIGGVIAVVMVGSAIRRKGFIGGAADTALNAVPYVGAAKNAVELVRGDIFPDRIRPSESSGSSRENPS